MIAQIELCVDCSNRPPKEGEVVCGYCKNMRRRELKDIRSRRKSESNSEWLPTQHPPGSEGKILVLTERDTLGLPLFHPEDYTAETAGRKNNASHNYPSRVE
jgi:hypothetical protein